MTENEQESEVAVTEPPVSHKSEGSYVSTIRWAVIAAMLAAALYVGNSLITLPYYILAPGDAISTKGYFSVPPEHHHDEKGKFLLTTVRLVDGHPFDFAVAKLTPGSQIVKEKEVRGNATPQQFQQENAADMNSSQQTAIYVALKQAGYDAQITGDGATVLGVRQGSPADGKFNPNDVITGLNGQAVHTSNELVARIARMKAGETVTIRVRTDNGAERDVSVGLVGRPEGVGGEGPMIGATVGTKNLQLKTPFTVKFKQTEIGGPSAGLAFTLAILNDITPGDLAAGKKVATTGTIDFEGNVGPVGGIEQKTTAVEREKVKLFLVPKDEEAEAKKYASSGLEVVGVSTLQDALNALRDHGGDISGATQKQPAMAA